MGCDHKMHIPLRKNILIAKTYEGKLSNYARKIHKSGHYTFTAYIRFPKSRNGIYTIVARTPYLFVFLR